MAQALFQIINGTIGGQPQYFPGYIKQNGEFVSPHLTVPIYVNSRRDRQQVGGPQAKRENSMFELTLWGEKLCAVGAHWWTKGKTMTFLGHMTSKRLQVTHNGQIVHVVAGGNETDPETGQKFQAGMQIPLWRRRPSFIVDTFEFGEDSAEVNRQKPAGWNIEGTPGHAQWSQVIQQIQQLVNAGYQGGDTFGLAKVGRVNGQIARKDPQTGQVIALNIAPVAGYGGAAPQANTVVPVANQPVPNAMPNQQVIQNPAMMNAGAAMPNTNVPPIPGMQPNPGAAAMPQNLAMPNGTVAPQFTGGMPVATQTQYAGL